MRQYPGGREFALFLRPQPPGGGGGGGMARGAAEIDPGVLHIKVTGVLVVPFRG